MDVHNKKTRSFNMSRITGKDTKPELILRKWLWNNGFRYRLHKKDLPGKPDIIFPGKKKTVFVHGCFWHKHNCKYFKWPKSNVDFWKKKINETSKRDLRKNRELKSLGWDILVVWECELKNPKESGIFNKVTKYLVQ